MPELVDRVVSIMERVAEGNYTDEIMEFTKPHYPEHVRRMAEAMGMMLVQVEARELRLEGLVQELERLNGELKENVVRTVSAIARALGARDKDTEGHAERVAEYAVELARCAGLDDTEIGYVRVGAILHDVGKIGFSDRIFQHEDLILPDDMLKEVRSHPEIGAEILKDLNFLGRSAEYVLHHHERLDGSGYPAGLKENEIPSGAKIIAIADCFDAMTTNRSYQKSLGIDAACGILKKLAGSGLDETLVDLFINDVLPMKHPDRLPEEKRVTVDR